MKGNETVRRKSCGHHGSALFTAVLTKDRAIDLLTPLTFLMPVSTVKDVAVNHNY